MATQTTSITTSSYQMIEQAKLFSAAVHSVFENWHAFKLATSMGNEARDMSAMIIGATEQCFHDNRDLDSGPELGEWIGEMLDINLNLRIEDGSLDDIGNQLVTYWRIYQNQEYDKLRKILEDLISVYPSMNLIPKVVGDDSSDDEGDEDDGEEKMDVDHALSQPSTSHQESTRETTSKVDADGWTTVTGKKRK